MDQTTHCNNNKNGISLYFTTDKYTATCVWNDDGFLLLKDSKLSISNSKSCPRTFDTKRILETYNINSVQFIIYHPPYWDIIKFSEDENDLSNSTSLDEFINNFQQVVRNTSAILEKGRYCAVVIGDKYANSQLVPLGFYCMQATQQEGLTLKATIVKNFEETKGKANQKALWRQRALQNGLYLFKHEYIFVFKK